jgi:hypothetical protein
MGVSGRINQNGLLPSPAPVTSIVEGDDRCRTVRVAGATLRGAGFAGAPLIGPTACGERAGREFASGAAFRAIRPVEPLRPGLASALSESVRDRSVMAEDGSAGPTRVAESSGCALRGWADGLSERDPALAGPGGFTSGVCKVFAASGVESRELVSRSGLSESGDMASTIGIDF